MKRVLRAEMLAPTAVGDGGMPYNTLSNRQFVLEWDEQMLVNVAPRVGAGQKPKRGAIVPLTACKALVLMTEADIAAETDEIAKAEEQRAASAKRKAAVLARAAMTADERVVAAVEAKLAEKVKREAADDTMVMRKRADGQIIEMTRADAKKFDTEKKAMTDVLDNDTYEPE